MSDWSVDIDWGYADTVAVRCTNCEVAFTVEVDKSEFAGGTCQECGGRLETAVR